MHNKPTIEELEKILSGEMNVNIEILPNGEIKEIECKEGEITKEVLTMTSKGLGDYY